MTVQTNFKFYDKNTHFIEIDGLARADDVVPSPLPSIGTPILDFGSWINLNIDELNCEIHENGLYSEYDFDFDVFYSRRYESYVLGHGVNS